MRTVKLLLAVQIRALFSGTNRKKRDGRKSNAGVWTIVGAALIYAVLLLCFGVMALSVFMIMGMALAENGGSMAFLPGIAGLVCFLLCLVGSVFMTLNTLYSAKDNELLLSLPVSPAAILISRMLFLLIVNYAFGAVVAVPAFVVYLVFGGTPVGAILFAFFFLLIPVLALAVSCLLGWLLALGLSRIRHKNILGIVLAVLFFGLYFAFVFNMETMMGALETNITGIIASASPYISLFWLPAHAIADGAILEGLVFVAILAAVCGLTLAFLSKTYISIVTTKRSAARIAYREKVTRGHGTIVTLMRREIAHFVSSWYYMFNEGIGLLVAPILGVVALISRDRIAALPAMFDEIAGETGVPLVLPEGIVALAFACALCVMSSMVIISAPSVSVEGKSLWIVRSLPLDGKTVLLSKALAHYALTVPFFLVGSVLGAIGASADVVGVLTLVLLPQLTNLFCALLGVSLNVIFPRFDWISEMVALKSGAAVMLTMLGMMLGTFLLAGACLGLSFWGLPVALIALLCLVLLAGLCLALYAYLAGPGGRRFEKL